MTIQLSELKSNPGKYFELAQKSDIIVTRRGKRLGRIVNEEKAAKSDDKQAFDELMRYMRETPSKPDDTVYNPIRQARLSEDGLLP